MISKEAVAIVVIFLFVLLVVCWPLYEYSWYNTRDVYLARETYHVHRSHKNQEDAARLLREITRRNRKLLKYLGGKYEPSANVGLDPTKNNRIDVIPGSELYVRGGALEQMMESHGEYLQERVHQLLFNYDPTQIYEISPLNQAGYTSYTQDKHILILCLRHKNPNASGEYQLHDINTVMFVVLHELSHMMNNLWGHKMDFWLLFKFMLINAVECGIYQPVDYARHPIRYCGLLLSYNPLFEPY